MGSDFTSPVRANTACKCIMNCSVQKMTDRLTVQSAAMTWQRDVQDDSAYRLQAAKQVLS